MDPVPPMVLMAVTSNASGLLTLVGDPATFIVGSSINMTFSTYLSRASAGGALCLVIILVLIPILFRDCWRARFTSPETVDPVRISHPYFLAASLGALAMMVGLFVLGGLLLLLRPA